VFASLVRLGSVISKSGQIAGQAVSAIDGPEISLGAKLLAEVADAGNGAGGSLIEFNPDIPSQSWEFVRPAK
jgi:hypothetical protein